MLVQAVVHRVRTLPAGPRDADRPPLDALVVVLLRLPAPHQRAFLHERDQTLLLLPQHLGVNLRARGSEPPPRHPSTFAPPVRHSSVSRRTMTTRISFEPPTRLSGVALFPLKKQRRRTL